MTQRDPHPESETYLEYDPTVADMAQRLSCDRLEPAAPFRGQIGRFLAAVDASGLLAARPRRLWLRVGSCAFGGCLALGFVAAGMAGWGPFGA
jgi:hypothetical protein